MTSLAPKHGASTILKNQNGEEGDYMNYVKNFNLFGVEAQQIPCAPNAGAPTSSTEGAIGCLYMNTDNGDIYKCTAVNEADDGSKTYTWLPLSTGGSADVSGISEALDEIIALQEELIGV